MTDHTSDTLRPTRRSSGNGVCAYRIPMDQAGRMVIPKDIRRKLGLQPGCHLLCEIQDDNIVLRPEVARDGCLDQKDGILVLCGEFYGSMPTRKVTVRNAAGREGEVP